MTLVIPVRALIASEIAALEAAVNLKLSPAKLVNLKVLTGAGVGLETSKASWCTSTEPAA
jgi:hypothetical protein